MANTKPIDKSKSANKKCEHCNCCVENSQYTPGPHESNLPYLCTVTGKGVNYWNRCKEFTWNEHKNYIN